MVLPHYSLDGAVQAFRPAVEPVVEAKPPGQDLDFPVAFRHGAYLFTKRQALRHSVLPLDTPRLA